MHRLFPTGFAKAQRQRRELFESANNENREPQATPGRKVAAEEIEMTPAEKLAAKRPIKRPPRNLKKYTRKVTWSCHCRAVRMELRLSMDEVVKALKLSKTAYWQFEKGGDPMLMIASSPPTKSDSSTVPRATSR